MFGIISQTNEALRNNKVYYFKVLLFPALLMVFLFFSHYVIFKIYPDMPQWLGWVFMLVRWGSYAVFAVVCHRLILVLDAPLAPCTLSLTRRELWFSLYMLLTGVVVFSLMWLVSIPLLTLFNMLGVSSSDWIFVISAIFGISQAYFLGRFCLVFPSIAVDEKISLKQSWMVAKGNSIRISCLVGVIPFFWFVLVEIMGHSSELAGSLTAGDVLLMFIQPVVLAFEVFLVSFIYKDIKENWITSNAEH